MAELFWLREFYVFGVNQSAALVFGPSGKSFIEKFRIFSYFKYPHPVAWCALQHKVEISSNTHNPSFIYSYIKYKCVLKVLWCINSSARFTFILFREIKKLFFLDIYFKNFFGFFCSSLRYCTNDCHLMLVMPLLNMKKIKLICCAITSVSP